jgi:hypothetical protein
LSRRRKVGEKSRDSVLGSLGDLDLDADDDDMFFEKVRSRSKSPGPKDSKSRSKSPKLKKGRKPAGDAGKSSAKSANKRGSVKRASLVDNDNELRTSLQGLSPDLRAKLKTVLDKEVPMKERLELEVKMMKNPDERKILADFKYKFERKNFNLKIFEAEVEKEEELEKNLEEEAKRSEVEEKEFAKRRQERLDEENAKKERDAKLKRDVKVHKAKGVAEGAEELRKEAEKTIEAAVRNKEKKERAEREREQRIQDFINGEGKDMTHVNRELVIARMLNDGSL